MEVEAQTKEYLCPICQYSMVSRHTDIEVLDATYVKTTGDDIPDAIILTVGRKYSCMSGKGCCAEATIPYSITYVPKSDEIRK